MRKRVSLLLAAPLLGACLAGPAQAAEEKKEMPGQAIAFDNKKGNCLACHSIPGDPKADTMANIAPPLVAMKSRYPDRAKLRDQIWDASKANPRTSMPPFGKHKIVTEQELDKIVDYIQSL